MPLYRGCMTSKGKISLEYLIKDLEKKYLKALGEWEEASNSLLLDNKKISYEEMQSRKREVTKLKNLSDWKCKIFQEAKLKMKRDR